MTRAAAIRNLRRVAARHKDADFAWRVAGSARDAFLKRRRADTADLDVRAAEALLARLARHRDS